MSRRASGFCWAGVGTIVYFGFFLFLPVLGWIEKPLPLPSASAIRAGAVASCPETNGGQADGEGVMRSFRAILSGGFRCAHPRDVRSGGPVHAEEIALTKQEWSFQRRLRHL